MKHFRHILLSTALLLLFALHGVFLTSCSGCMSDFASEYHSVKVDSATDVVYNQYLAINNELWNKTDSLVFDLPMVESPADLEVNISVRYTNRYPYQNLQIIAFLEELDTTNIINSLPIRQNDSRIDSLIQREDSLKKEKDRAEHFLSERVAARDSLLLVNRDSVLAVERADSLRRDSMKRALKKAKKEKQHLSKEQLDSLRNDSLSKDSVRMDSIQKEKLIEQLRQQHTADSIAAVEQSLTHAIDFKLFNEKDKKSGVGMMFVETGVDCGTIHLKANTRYRIKVSHNMRDQVVRGISDVGIILRCSQNAKPLNKNTRWW